MSVPWTLYFLTLSLVALTTPAGAIKCEHAHLRCAFRYGCGQSLKLYMMGCSRHRLGPGHHCPEDCQNALIALTSTDEGKELMTCECSDDVCRNSKLRIDVCRPYVTRMHNSTVVPCRVAESICMADMECSTALDYYHRLCHSMFSGKKCTHKCKNSIAILLRQEKAAKLPMCQCDGREPYKCKQIKHNMDTLCFPERPQGVTGTVRSGNDNEESNDVLPQTTTASATSQTPLPIIIGTLLVATSVMASKR